MHLTILPDATWAVEVASRWMGFLRDHPAAHICLPTGGTPEPVYREAVARGLDLRAATVFILDEFGGLPEGHLVRCDAFLRHHLLTPLGERAGAHHFLDVDADDRDAECARYEELVGGDGLDLSLLGLGHNGHIGLNEPGSARTSRTRAVDLTRSTIDALDARLEGTPPPTWGMTMGMATLMASREIWLLVAGEGKAEAVRRTYLGPVTEEHPASLLRSHDNAHLIVDESAASLL